MRDLCFTKLSITETVLLEHERQIRKWGVQDHNAFQWLAFATEELGETSQAISEYSFRDGKAKDVVKEAVQCAVLCLKIAEMFQEDWVKE